APAAEPALRAGGVVSAHLDPLPAPLAALQQRVGGLVGGGDRIARHCKAAVLAAVDQLVLAGAVMRGRRARVLRRDQPVGCGGAPLRGDLEPDEEGLTAGGAGRGRGVGTLPEADRPAA